LVMAWMPEMMEVIFVWFPPSIFSRYESLLLLFDLASLFYIFFLFDLVSLSIWLELLSSWLLFFREVLSLCFGGILICILDC